MNTKTDRELVRAYALENSEEAFAELVRRYADLVYGTCLRITRNRDDAQDLTQEFFARLLAKDFLAGVDREKGKFRAFLLASMKHFLSNERDRLRAQRRGGGHRGGCGSGDASLGLLVIAGARLLVAQIALPVDEHHVRDA